VNARSAARGARRHGRAPHARLQRDAGPRPRAGRTERVVGEHERVGELGADLEAGVAHQRADRGPVEELDMADPRRLGALRRSRRGAVVLERHLDEDQRRQARRLGQQRRGVGHVLEDMREHDEVVGAVGGGDTLAVEDREARGGDIVRARDRDRGLGHVEPVEARRDAARRELPDERS
jgi:hypothetical protein